MGDPNITFKCKECFNDIDKTDLIYPKRGYPYCKDCFNGKLSLVDKEKFEPCFKHDIPFIEKSIKDSNKTISDVMGGLNRRSDNFLKGKGYVDG